MQLTYNLIGQKYIDTKNSDNVEYNQLIKLPCGRDSIFIFFNLIPQEVVDPLDSNTALQYIFLGGECKSYGVMIAGYEIVIPVELLNYPFQIFLDDFLEYYPETLTIIKIRSAEDLQNLGDNPDLETIVLNKQDHESSDKWIENDPQGDGLVYYVGTE